MTLSYPLKNSRFAQRDYSRMFSREGRRKYSQMAGKKISTVDQLARAIKEGRIDYRQLPVDYIVRDGYTLILNTRTSAALMKAGIPMHKWNAINRTGIPLYEQMLTDQLNKNNLTSEGILFIVPNYQ